MPVKLNFKKGQIINRVNGETTQLKYLGESAKSSSTRRVLRVKCYCGKNFESGLGALRNGGTKSCGCLLKELYESGRAGFKHGLTFRPDYQRLNALRYKYNLTIEDYDKLYRSQKGRCKICGIKQEDLKRKLSVDHDHTTNKIRGLLCNGCNRGLGYFNDEISKLKNAIDYLIHNS